MIKKIVRTLPLVMVAWFVITLFFYVQHYRIEKVYTVNKEVVLEDMVIKLQEVSIKNYRYNEKIKRVQSTYEPLWYYKLVPKLPRPVQWPFIRVCTFYSRPYVYDNQFGPVSTKGLILFKTEAVYPEYNNIWDFIDITLVDENNVHYGRNKAFSGDSGSTYIVVDIKDENASFENEVYKIIVKDKRNNVERTFYTQPSGWEIKTLTYFDQGNPS